MVTVSLIASEAPPGSVRFVRDSFTEIIVSFDERADSIIMLITSTGRASLVETNIETLAGFADEFERP